MEAGALLGLPGKAVTHAAGEVGDMDAAGGVVLHLDGAGDGLILGMDELHDVDVARVVAESPGR